MTKRLCRFAAVLGAFVLLTCPLLERSALASTTNPQTATISAADLQAEVNDVIRRTPGAYQLGPNTVAIGPGAVMRLSTGGVQPNDLTAYCSYQYMCVYNNRNFNVGTTNGHEIDFFTCGREWNLGRVAFPGGGYWNDKVSSIINNQTSGTTSRYYNYRGYGGIWDLMTSLAADHHLSDLALNTWTDPNDGKQKSMNDMIDGIHVCGSVPSPWTPNYP
jgi:Peptidase inhibitor family I36